jgi:hypothetical protein
MKDIFSLVAFTGAAICFAVFLTTVQSDDLPELRWAPSATSALYAPGNACRLQGPLLVESHDGLGVLAHLRDV